MDTTLLLWQDVNTREEQYGDWKKTKKGKDKFRVDAGTDF
jgi:hypothetical protein